MKLLIFNNKRTLAPRDFDKSLQIVYLHGYRTTSNEKIKISLFVTPKITPISGYVTLCKPAARALKYLEMYVLLHVF